MDTLKRKFRRISNGNQYTRDSYADLSRVFKNGIAQPDYEFFGVDTLDVNADISFTEFIFQYEKLFGEIELDSCEMKRPLTNPNPCEKAQGKINAIIFDYRNHYVADILFNADHNKIVLLYGASHINPIRKLLKNMQKDEED